MDFNFTERIARLLFRYLREELSEAEQQELEAWRSSSTENDALIRRIETDEYLEEQLKIFISGKKHNPDLWKKIRKQQSLLQRRRTLRRIGWSAAAAVVLVAVGLILLPPSSPPEQLVGQGIISPGQHKAILQLEDGRVVEISGQESFHINPDISVSSERLEYQKQAVNSGFHSLKTPRGGEYSLKLSDGTIVFLNSESEIRYPSIFDGSNREVELKGEAYFNVAPDPEKPFVVKTGEIAITVVGTSFNINSYYPEQIETALESGEIAIRVKGSEKVWSVKPSQLAVFTATTGEMTICETDIRPYVAWKEGDFIFKQQSLDKIAASLSRWYDVDFEFRNPAIRDLRFTGDISRHSNIEIILNALSEAVDVNYTIEEKTIVFY